jgi:hypothetical protein
MRRRQCRVGVSAETGRDRHDEAADLEATAAVRYSLGIAGHGNAIPVESEKQEIAGTPKSLISSTVLKASSEQGKENKRTT